MKAAMPFLRRFILLLAFVMCMGGAALYGLSHQPAQFTGGDEGAYLAAAYHLVHHGTFSEAQENGPVPPAVGREPGYGVLLALLMTVDPAFGSITPACLRAADACDRSLLAAAQTANLALIGLAAFALFAAARLAVPGCPAAAWIAALYLLANVEMHADWYYVGSDDLAVFLVALVLLATAWAGRGVGWGRWAAAGAALAALTFVKAVFLVFALAAAAAAAIAALVARGPARRRILAALLAAGIAWTVPVGAWMVRNAEIAGDLRFTDSRSGIALNTREVFNHWTGEQYLASFVYWTRGFGDDLAARWFSKETVAPFRIDNPDGFYMTRQFGYERDVQVEMAATGLNRVEAAKRVDAALMQRILDRPFTHIATTVPVFYRGLWIDEFILVGLPALLWVLLTAVRRGQPLQLLLLAPGVFNLLFYALVSLNIDRYQMTAVPALALAAGIALPALGRRLIRRRPLLAPPGKAVDNRIIYRYSCHQSYVDRDMGARGGRQCSH